MRMGKRVAVCVLALLVSLFLLSAVTSSTCVSQMSDGVTSPTLRSLHPPIKIDNNMELVYCASTEGWPGMGTPEDPYIIQNYVIDAQGAGSAIYIGNTSLHFVIRNCTLYNTSFDSWDYGKGSGVTLYNVANGVVENNTIYGNIVVENNITYGTIMSGIDVIKSINIMIRDNIISNSSSWGIRISTSSYVLIEGNTILYAPIGIGITESSQNNIISRNKCVAKEGGRGIEIDDGCVKNIITNNNLYNGYYIAISISSKENRILNNTCINNYFGIYLFEAPENYVENNTFNMNEDSGMLLYRSHNSTLLNNTCNSNGYAGIFLDYSDDVMIANNTCSFNEYLGIYASFPSNRLLLLNNTCESNLYGIYLACSEGSTVRNNVLIRNRGYGVCLGLLARSNTVYNNAFFYNNNSTDYYNGSCIQAYDRGRDNEWYTQENGGNYWNDWAKNNDTNDLNCDGFVDYPYVIYYDGYGLQSKDIKPLKWWGEALPRVRSVSPLPGEKRVNINEEIVITFTEQMNPSTFNFSCFPDPGGWAVKWNENMTLVRLRHNSFEYNVTYVFTIEYIEDIDGKNISMYRWSFTTEPMESTSYPVYVIVDGKVVDSDGNPVVGATVSAETGEMVFTDSDGRFAIMLTPGEHVLKVRKEGYRYAEFHLVVYPEGSYSVGLVVLEREHDIFTEMTLPGMLGICIFSLALFHFLMSAERKQMRSERHKSPCRNLQIQG